jgi:hypothetical protein
MALDESVSTNACNKLGVGFFYWSEIVIAINLCFGNMCVYWTIFIKK